MDPIPYIPPQHLPFWKDVYKEVFSQHFGLNDVSEAEKVAAAAADQAVHLARLREKEPSYHPSYCPVGTGED